MTMGAWVLGWVSTLLVVLAGPRMEPPPGNAWIIVFIIGMTMFLASMFLAIAGQENQQK